MGWIGASFDETGPTDDIVKIRRIVPDSPASRAGLRVGDRVFRVAGYRVSDAKDVVRAIAKRPNQQIEMKVGKGFLNEETVVVSSEARTASLEPGDDFGKNVELLIAAGRASIKSAK